MGNYMLRIYLSEPHKPPRLGYPTDFLVRASDDAITPALPPDPRHRARFW